jgi:hypothetical protein
VTQSKGPNKHESIETADHVDPATLRSTSVAAYLLIARYNRATFKGFETQPSPDSSLTNRQQEAHEAAEELFPEEEEARPLSSKKTDGWVLARSFHTGLHDAIKAALLANEQLASPRRQADVVDEVVQAETARVPRPYASGTDHIPDPLIGWVMVVEADKFGGFRQQFGPSNALWEMYDIEVIPLNGDASTQDIYEFMTPVNWQK